MTTLDYEAEHHRLRITGVCRDDDAPALADVVSRLSRASVTLIVDLTAVSAMTPEVARSLVTSQTAAERCRVTLLRKSGSMVDRRLQAALPQASVQCGWRSRSQRRGGP